MTCEQVTEFSGSHYKSKSHEKKSKSQEESQKVKKKVKQKSKKSHEKNPKSQKVTKKSKMKKIQKVIVEIKQFWLLKSFTLSAKTLSALILVTLSKFSH